MKRILIALAGLLALWPLVASAEDEASGLRYQRCLDEGLDPKERIPACEQLIKDHGTYVGYAWLGLGSAYAAAGDPQKALAAYAHLENFRYWTAPKTKRGELYVSMGDYDKALADANDVIEMRGGRVTGLFSRCWARAALNKEIEAGLADCDEVLKELPRAAVALEARAIILLRMGRFADAIAGFDATLAVNDKRFAALYMRGYAKKQNGDAAGGDADMAAALAANPRAVDFFARNGVVPKP